MYSGLLPKGLTDAEMSSDDEDDQGVANQEIAATNVQRPAVGLSPGLKQNCVTLGDTSYSSIQPFIENDPCLDSLPGIPRRFGKYVKCCTTFQKQVKCGYATHLKSYIVCFNVTKDTNVIYTSHKHNLLTVEKEVFINGLMILLMLNVNGCASCSLEI